MHESGLIEDLLKKVEARVGADRAGEVSEIIVQASGFGGIKKRDLLEHFYSFVEGTSWENTNLQVQRSPYGAPLTLVNVKLKQ